MLMRVRSRRKRPVTPEIGLTPLIDTALTLLIIFMVTTPVLENAIKVELPKGALKEGNEEQQELVITIDKKGDIYCNNKVVTLDNLGVAVQELVAKQGKQEKSVWIRVQGETTTVTMLTAVIDRVKLIGGVKDVKIATQKPLA